MMEEGQGTERDQTDSAHSEAVAHQLADESKSRDKEPRSDGLEVLDTDQFGKQVAYAEQHDKQVVDPNDPAQSPPNSPYSHSSWIYPPKQADVQETYFHDGKGSGHFQPSVISEGNLENTEKPVQKICGLKRRTFFLLLCLVLVVIVAAVGGGVGGALASRSGNSKAK